MIPFNIPPYVPECSVYVEQAIQNHKICGDGVFTKRCNEALKAIAGVPCALLTTSGTSALEMAQNSVRYSWTRKEVDQKLRDIMSSIYDASAAAAEEYGLGYDLIAGNDIASFKKIAQAMMAQGL